MLKKMRRKEMTFPKPNWNERYHPHPHPHQEQAERQGQKMGRMDHPIMRDAGSRTKKKPAPALPAVSRSTVSSGRTIGVGAKSGNGGRIGESSLSFDSHRFEQFGNRDKQE